MNDFLLNSVYWGIILNIIAYLIGLWINKKFKLAIFNPLLISVIIVIIAIICLNIDFDAYKSSSKYLTFLLTPATVSLAVPLYEKLDILKANIKAVGAGLISGVIISFLTVLSVSIIFKLSHTQYVTLLPKSITTAIGMDLSKELGGFEAITAATIAITGIVGNMCAESVFRILNIKNPIAKGLALGSASHAMGTSRAIEMGETEGAMAGLSIAVSGILTVIAVNAFVLVR